MNLAGLAPLAAAVALALTACGPPAAPAGAPAPPAPSAPPGARVSGGVTAEPCPLPVNPGNGCIYLGALDDAAGGPLARRGAAHREARAAFWQRVNDGGGIAGYDVDVTTYSRDSASDPEAHRRAFAAMRDEVLAVASTQGLEPTAALLEDLEEAGMLALPTLPLSAWTAGGHLALPGTSVCADAANAVAAALERQPGAGRVALARYPGAYGDDAAAGVARASAAAGLEVTEVAVPAGSGTPQDPAPNPAADRLLAAAPDVLVVATGPVALAALVPALRDGGFAGTVVTLSPAWDERLRDRPALAGVLVTAPHLPWGASTRGHAALAAGLAAAAPEGAAVEPSEAHVAAWARQYALAAALEAAAGAGDLTPAGVREHSRGLTGFGSEGMVPGSGDAEARGRTSAVGVVDPAAPTGLRVGSALAGPGVTDLDPGLPCDAQPPG